MATSTLTLPEFIARWQASTLTERSAAHSHSIDLCEVLGQPRPAAVDLTGAEYTFEKGVAKTGGGKGWRNRSTTRRYHRRSAGSTCCASMTASRQLFDQLRRLTSAGSN